MPFGVNCLLTRCCLFRLGDFYEMFGDDAQEASAILNVALTQRGDMPMCGVPYHSARRLH